MKTTTVAELRADLSAHLDDVTRTHETVQVTRNGHPIAVIISADDWEAVEETLYWSQPENAKLLEEGIADIERGDTIPAEQVYAELAEKHGWPREL